MHLRYNDFRRFDTSGLWESRIEEVCREHTRDGGPGPFLQFRVDWINGGLLYALTQTIQYVGFGYNNAMIFKELGRVLGEIIEAFNKREIKGGTHSECDG